MRPAGHRLDQQQARRHRLRFSQIGIHHADLFHLAIDWRVDAYLRRSGLDDVVNRGAVYEDLIERVMANIGRARRCNHLASPEKLN